MDRAGAARAVDALDAGVAFVNALPVFIASDPEWAEKFAAARRHVRLVEVDDDGPPVVVPAGAEIDGAPRASGRWW